MFPGSIGGSSLLTINLDNSNKVDKEDNGLCKETGRKVDNGRVAGSNKDNDNPDNNRANRLIGTMNKVAAVIDLFELLTAMEEDDVLVVSTIGLKETTAIAKCVTTDSSIVEIAISLNDPLFGHNNPLGTCELGGVLFCDGTSQGTSEKVPAPTGVSADAIGDLGFILPLSKDAMITDETVAN